MILQANFHYEIDNKEKLFSTCGKSGNDFYLSLDKIMQDIKCQVVYFDNKFQKVFAIQGVELIILPDYKDKKADLENFLDLIFHISCQKGISAIAFHLRKDQITNKSMQIFKSENIQQIIKDFANKKDNASQEKQEEPKKDCFSLNKADYQRMTKELNIIFYGNENFQDLTKEQDQIFSLIIQKPNSNRGSSCFLENTNEIRVLSNFQIAKVCLYETNLVRSGEKDNKTKPSFFLNVEFIESKPMKNNYTYETIIKVDLPQKSENYLMFVFNENVLAFQFPLKFRDNY